MKALVGADGRFLVDYMSEQRRLMRDALFARQQLVRNGGGFGQTLTAGQAWDHVATNIADDEMAHVAIITHTRTRRGATSRSGRLLPRSRPWQ